MATIELMKFVCPTCSRLIKVKKDTNPMGKKMRCGGCQNIFTLAKECLQTPVPATPAPFNEEAATVIDPLEKYFSEEKSNQDEQPLEFGGYEILRILGEGGMGTVYEAFDLHLQKKVALKTLKISTQNNAEGSTRFLREAKASSQLDHPNIIKVYDVGIANDQYYFTMELVDGLSFKDALAAKDLLTLEQKLTILVKIADAMYHSHQKGIVHRDLKPGNIMLMKETYEPKLMDFGLVKLVEEVSKLTKTGTVLGTVDYMAPEQARGKTKEIGHLTDIYALGVILYQILTGDVPFKGKVFARKILDIVRTPPIPPNEIQPEIPKELSDICLKAMAKEKSERYQSAGELKAALEPFC